MNHLDAFEQMIEVLYKKKCLLDGGAVTASTRHATNNSTELLSN